MEHLKNRLSISILVGGFNQDFPLTGMIRLADDALLLHSFHQRGGTVVADLQTPLNIAGRSLAVARHDRHRLLIKIAAFAAAHRGSVEDRIAVFVLRIFGGHRFEIFRHALRLQMAHHSFDFFVRHEGPVHAADAAAADHVEHIALAKQLLGQGDMLYMAGGGRISRVHGPFVSDEEVEKVVRHLKAQGVPQYLEAVTAEEAEEGDGPAVFDGTPMGMASEAEGADLYQQAVQVVTRDRKASTSYIQRRLQIGYNRAASLMERMEKEGIVGPANHAGKREILIEGSGAQRDEMMAEDEAEA